MTAHEPRAPKPWSVLGATQVNPVSPFAVRICSTALSLLQAHTALEFVINAYAGSANQLPCARHSRIQTAQIAGSKALYWKLVLTPGLTSRFDAVWLFDGDMEIGGETLHLEHVLGVLKATGAPLLQPTVIPVRQGGRGTDNPELRPAAEWFSDACLVRTVGYVETQTPFFRGDAWRRFHADVLAVTPDALLLECDWIDIAMCPHAEDVLGGPCLITQGAHVVHMDAMRPCQSRPARPLLA